MNRQGLKGLVGQGMDGQHPIATSRLVYAEGFTSGSGSTPAQTVPVRACVYALGGGGGGGSYVLGSGRADGGGGGGAVYDEMILTPGQTLAYSVGTGGVGAMLAATFGGDTTVTSASGHRIVAQGGQGRIGGQGLGGLRRYKGGDGGPQEGSGNGANGVAGTPQGGDGTPGVEGTTFSYGAGGGGAANPGLPYGLLAATYPPGSGRSGTGSGTISTPSNFGGGGGGNTDGSGGAAKSGPGAGGLVVVVMTEIGRS